MNKNILAFIALICNLLFEICNSNAQGTWQWAKASTGNNGDEGFGVTADAAGLYLTQVHYPADYIFPERKSIFI